MGVATALLLIKLDPIMIQLVRLWKRNTMLLYLHITEKYLTKSLYYKIMVHGYYAITPTHTDLINPPPFYKIAMFWCGFNGW